MFKYKDLDAKSKKLLKSSQLPATIRDVIERVYPNFIKSYGNEGVKLKFALDEYDEELQTCKYVPGGHLPEFSLSAVRGKTEYNVYYGRYPNNDKILKLEKRDIIDREYEKYENAKYGYIDLNFKTVVPCIYEELGLLDADGRCFAKRDDSFYLVDKEGEILNPYDHKGICIAKSFLVFEFNKLCGLVDTYGVVTLEAEWEEIHTAKLDERILYDSFYSFNNYPLYRLQNWIEARNKDGLFLINDKGQMVSTEPYDEITPYITWMSYAEFRFYNSLLRTERHGDKSNGLVDIVEKTEMLPTRYSISNYSRCVYVVHNGEACVLYSPLKHCFLFDFSERWEDIRLEDDYNEYASGDMLDCLEEYLFPAKRGGKWGYMNVYGVEKIKCKFDEAGFFRNGVAKVYITDYAIHGCVQSYHIDRHGNVVRLS